MHLAQQQRKDIVIATPSADNRDSPMLILSSSSDVGSSLLTIAPSPQVPRPPIVKAFASEIRARPKEMDIPAGRRESSLQFATRWTQEEAKAHN